MSVIPEAEQSLEVTTSGEQLREVGSDLNPVDWQV